MDVEANIEKVDALKEFTEEFEKEALPHIDSLYAYAYKITQNSDDAEDLVQETYLKAFRFFDKYERGTNIRAWLYRIMKNSYINEYRKNQKEPDKLDYDDIQNFYENIKSTDITGNHLQEDAFGKVLNDDVSSAISELPDDFRTVIILSDLENFTYEEIAEFVDCPVGTVRSRLHRARKMLYSRLHTYAKSKGFADESD